MKDPRTCLIMLGRLGDVINVLPIAKYFADTTGHRAPLMTCPQYTDTTNGCSYVESIYWERSDLWASLLPAVDYASNIFERVINLQTGGKDFAFKRQCASFCEEPYATAGLTGQRGKLPLIFDKRSADWEALLLSKHDLTKPIVLYSLKGVASPLAEALQLLAAIQQIPNITLIDTNTAGAASFFDLLALYDRAACLVTIDTATLHLAYASRVPVLALTNNKPVPWHGTIPIGNIVFHARYSEAASQIDKIRDKVQHLCATSHKF